MDRLILGLLEELGTVAGLLCKADIALRSIPRASNEPLLLVCRERLSKFEDPSHTTKIPTVEGELRVSKGVIVPANLCRTIVSELPGLL